MDFGVEFAPQRLLSSEPDVKSTKAALKVEAERDMQPFEEEGEAQDSVLND